MNINKDLVAGFYDSESEKAILGSLMLDNELYFLVSDIIKENDFYNSINQRLYIEIKEMILAGAKVDLVSLRSWLKEKNLFERVGGITYLSNLCELVSTTSNSEEYAKNIKKKSILRRLFRHLQKSNYGIGLDLSEFLSELDTKINEFTGELTFDDARSNSEVIEEIAQEIKIARERKEKILGIPTGFIQLDNATSGLRKEEMWIIAGRPSQGKTLTGLNIGVNITKGLIPVLIISLEQSQKQLLQRSFAKLTGINLTRIRTGDIFDNENVIIKSKMGEKRIPLGAYTILLFEKAGFEILDNIIWYKGEPQSNRHKNDGNYTPYYQRPANCYEHMFIFKKKGKLILNKEISKINIKNNIIKFTPVFKIGKGGENRYGHTAPFPKMIPLLSVDTFTNEKDIVLDPFSGSGTTPIVANLNKRNGVGIELNKEYSLLSLEKAKDENIDAELIEFKK